MGALGKRALVLTTGRKKYEGKLLECESGNVTIVSDDGTKRTIALSDVKRGNLVYEIQKGPKKGAGPKKGKGGARRKQKQG